MEELWVSGLLMEEVVWVWFCYEEENWESWGRKEKRKGWRGEKIIIF